jgi:hypothetical protein
MKRLIKAVFIVFAILFAISGVMALTFQRRNPATLRAVAEWNRKHLNPRMLKLAGKSHWYAASLHHIGRKTGRHLETPIVAHRIGDLCFIPLPYGESVDWLKNVQVAGSGSLVDHGEAFQLTNPRVVTSDDALAHLESRQRTRYRWFGVKQFLAADLRPVPGPAAEAV